MSMLIVDAPVPSGSVYDRLIVRGLWFGGHRLVGDHDRMLPSGTVPNPPPPLVDAPPPCGLLGLAAAKPPIASGVAASASAPARRILRKSPVLPVDPRPIGGLRRHS